MSAVWKCMSCGNDLPSPRRSDMRYCGGRCRVAAHRIRKGEGQHARPTKKRGHTALKEQLMNTREQPAPGVTAQDIERWLDADRDRLRRLDARRLPDAPDELLDAEIALVQATIGQLEAELHFMAVERRHSSQTRSPA